MTEKAPSRVAVVDDDAAIRRLVRHILRREGHDIIECTTGNDARVTLRREPWDIAILDRRLPDMDGLDLCKEFKADPEYRTRYIIMLTGEDEQSEKISGLETGADDYITKPFHMPELRARVRVGKRIVDLQKELQQLSITDGLTGLNNHRKFQDELRRAFEESARYGRPLSLALMDLDFFKKVNDTYGHAIGDEVLKHAAAAFKEQSRQTDIPARYGGEEFAVIMPETPLEDALLFAEKIRLLIAETPVPTPDGQLISITVSIGVSTVPHPRIQSPHELVEDADKCLYEAKRRGRNQVYAERRRQEDPHRPRDPVGGGTAHAAPSSRL